MPRNSLTLKQGFRIALAQLGYTEADFARSIGKSRNYVSAVSRGKLENTPGMTNTIREFTKGQLAILRDKLNAGIHLE